MTLLTLCRQINIWKPRISEIKLTCYIRRFSLSLVHNDKEISILDDDSLVSQLEDIKHIFDLRDPAQFFMKARSMKRNVIFHAGPTNSGKTHHALESYFNAKSGLYCGPLRMLANEIFRKTNDRDIPCDLVTGEEKIYAIGEDEPANHISCTVELCSHYQKHDVAVIDEIQMLRDPERGYAWTRALLGVVAEEVHVCGEESAIELVKKLLKKTNDNLEIRTYKRLTPLKILPKSLKTIDRLKSGDCLVAFSQKRIYAQRTLIQEMTKLKCAVIYGNLPSNIRVAQARKFNSGECDVLVSSDAIGMGLNLKIKRLIFSNIVKSDGTSIIELTPHHIKQIAGRAGRYKTGYEVGKVTTLNDTDHARFKELMETPIEPIKKAGILPTFEQLQLLSLALPGKTLLDLLDVFELLIMLDKNFFLCDKKMRDMKKLSKELSDIPLTLHESFLFAIAPVKTRSPLVFAFAKQFAVFLSQGTRVTDEKVKQMIRWPPRNRVNSLRQLVRLEDIHEALDLYRWLSLKFEDIFLDVDGILALQRHLTRIISRAVDTNFTQYKRTKSYKDSK